MTHPIPIYYPIQNDLPFRRKVVKTDLSDRIQEAHVGIMYPPHEAEMCPRGD